MWFKRYKIGWNCMSEEREFVGQIVSNKRVTVPIKICKLLKLQEGDYVRIKISKEKR